MGDEIGEGAAAGLSALGLPLGNLDGMSDRLGETLGNRLGVVEGKANSPLGLVLGELVKLLGNALGISDELGRALGIDEVVGTRLGVCIVVTMGAMLGVVVGIKEGLTPTVLGRELGNVLGA